MLYPYLYKKTINDINIYFHPVTMDVLFAPADRDEREIEEYVKNTELHDNWVFDENFSYDQYIDEFLKNTEYQKIDIKTLKMFTTTVCNLDCAYCLIEKNLKFRGCECKHLNLDKGYEVLDKFSALCLSQKRAKRTVMLYGGEPLTNKDTLFELIRRIRAMEKDGKFNGEVEIDLECNGTLVTDEIAEFLKDYNVFILISLDGIRKVHNKYRKTKTGEGSYDAAKKGFDTLIRHGCTAVISSVFTDEYAKHVDECIDEMTDVVRPKSIGLNIFHVLEDQEIENDHTSELLDRYIHAFEKASEKGLYIEHIMRRIRPLTSKVVRISDCGACGNRIVSDVDGNIGICEGLVGNPEYFKERTDYNEVKQDPEFIRWSLRTPLKMDSCKACKAVGICGAGCVSNAIRQNGDIYTPDNYICESSKMFIDWALEKWYRNTEFNKADYHILNAAERDKLLGSLKKKFDIPLQTVSKQYEKEKR